MTELICGISGVLASVTSLQRLAASLLNSAFGDLSWQLEIGHYQSIYTKEIGKSTNLNFSTLHPHPSLLSNIYQHTMTQTFTSIIADSNFKNSITFIYCMVLHQFRGLSRR